MKSDPSAANQKKMGEAGYPFYPDILKMVFDNVQDGVLIIDATGNLLEINPKGLTLHGLEEADKEHLKNNPLFFHKVYNAGHQELPADEWPVMKLLNGESFDEIPYIIKINEQGPEVRISYSGISQFSKEGIFTSGILLARKTSEANIRADLVNDVFEKEEQLKKLELYQQQLKDERELLHTLIDTIPVMVTIYDKRIHSFSMNRAFEEITGWTSDDIEEINIMELAYPDPEYRKEVFEYMQSLTPGFKDIAMRTRDGRQIETSWANVELPDGRQVGVGIDISDRKQLENELITAREKAERENQVQYAFIQNISHEVRTPMNSILGFTELLQKEVAQKKEAEFLNAISQNGKQLLRLIDDIIDFSQLDNNQISLQKEIVVVNNFMRRIELQMLGMKKAYKKRHLNLIVKKPENNVQVIVNTDSFRLQQVLMNLIGNAIKYTEEGTVEIGYEIRESGKDIVFYVKDTGIGISDNDKEKVFKRFNRLHNTRSREFRGTGLGLAICKHLVNLLGGEIWFDSELGVGTVFYFSHPYRDLEKSESASAEAIVENDKQTNDFSLPDLSDKVILIVEDDSFSYMMMYHMLEETKALILHADSGSKAVEIFNKYKTDLVFLDIRIPEMDGYQIIQHIRESNKSIPVIAQTANALPEDRRKIASAGFNYHITKPISRDSLFSVLNKFLQVKKST